MTIVLTKEDSKVVANEIHDFLDFESVEIEVTSAVRLTFNTRNGTVSGRKFECLIVDGHVVDRAVKS